MDNGTEGIMTTRKASWKASWELWFAGQEGIEARSILENGLRRNMPAVPRGGDMASELRRITKSDGNTAEAELRARLESLTIEQLRDYVLCQVQDLKTNSDSWDDKREAGWRKVTTGAQDFVEAADSFLAGFAGVVEVANLADTQFGGAASLVLALFFATIKLKASNDRAIQSSMRTIASRLPDLEIYYQISADKHLATLLSNAYVDVFVFALTATRYFQGCGISRLAKTIAEPQKFQDMEKSMAQNLKEVRIRCNALVAERIFSLSAQNDELGTQVESLRKEVQALRESEDQNAANAIRQKLGRHDSGSRAIWEKNFSDYRRHLANIFSGRPYLTSMKLHDLQRLPECQTWQTADASMLVLHGRNDRDSPPQSWLSPAAQELIQSIRELGASSVVAQCNCKPKMAPEEAMKTIIEQLLDQRPQSIRSMGGQQEIAYHLRTTSSGLSSPASIDGGEMMPWDGLCSIVSSLLKGCGDSTYIFLDRPDLCEPGETWDFVKSLLKLVQDKNRVKILVVIRQDFWNIDERLGDLKESLSSQRLLVIRKDQEEI